MKSPSQSILMKQLSYNEFLIRPGPGVDLIIFRIEQLFCSEIDLSEWLKKSRDNFKPLLLDDFRVEQLFYSMLKKFELGSWCLSHLSKTVTKCRFRPKNSCRKNSPGKFEPRIFFCLRCPLSFLKLELLLKPYQLITIFSRNSATCFDLHDGIQLSLCSSDGSGQVFECAATIGNTHRNYILRDDNNSLVVVSGFYQLRFCCNYLCCLSSILDRNLIVESTDCRCNQTKTSTLKQVMLCKVKFI